MNNGKKLVLLCLALAFGQKLFATGIIYPVANFTLRSTDAGVSASQMDVTPNGSGFDGFLTHSTFVPSDTQVDQVYAEFNLSAVPSSWTSIALTFANTGLGTINPSTIQVTYYTGTGLPALSDWTLPTAPVANISGVTASPQSFTIDVTSLIDRFGGSQFLGFRFALANSPPNQSDQKLLQASSIELEQVPEPSTCLLGIFVFGAYLAARGFAFTPFRVRRAVLRDLVSGRRVERRI